MRGTIDIAAEVAGGRAALRQRPIISNFQCSAGPLAYDANALEAAFVFGEAGIPTGFMYMTIGAGTAPATVAGNAVLAHAEVLAGMVLFELLGQRIICCRPWAARWRIVLGASWGTLPVVWTVP